MFKRRALSASEVAQHSPGPPWQLYFEAKGRRHLWSLKFADKRSAIAEAKLKLDLYYDGREEDLRKTMQRGDKPRCSTFADVWAVLPRLSIDADDSTRQTYQWGARRTFALALGLANLEDVDRLSLSVLDGAHGELVFSKAKLASGAISNQSEEALFRRNVVYAFQFTRSLFSPMAVRSMQRDFNLALPDTIEEFRKSRKAARFKAPAATNFAAPDATLLRRTFRAWLKLGKLGQACTVTNWEPYARRRNPDDLQRLPDICRRNMFLSIGLMASCGLRKNEVAQIRWRHLGLDAEGRPRLVATDIKVKKGSGELSVRPLDPFWSLMWRVIQRNHWQGAADDYVLAERSEAPQDGAVHHRGGGCDRTYWPFYHVSCWLRGLGWAMQKTNHALRDLAASLVTMKFGLERAKIFARHENIATTESHYGRFVSERDMDDTSRLRWLKWAVARQEAL